MFVNRLIKNCINVSTNLLKNTELLGPVFSVSVNNCLRIFCSEAKTYASTIYALSSGHGTCGVAVVRISGPKAQQAIEKMTKIQKLEPRKTFLKKIYYPDTNEVIDKGLCIWFPGPASFTGEDSVEFQVHGGLAILNSLFSALSKLGFRQALPGEFTRRAFLNKKLDLTEIEGLADLIHAETEQQRRQALLQADGCLSKLYNQWSQDLLNSVASLEAFVDFSEDDNIEDGVVERCNQHLKILRDRVKNHLLDGRKGEILRSGVRTIILGEPNVGKSSLLNSLAQRNAAIVTPIAGTTRDIVELSINVSGYPIVLADTAGLTESTDVVEKEGIRKARSYAKQADLIILMMSATEFAKNGKSLNNYVKDYVANLKLEDLLMPDGHLTANCCVVVNKMDLIDNTRIFKQIRESGAVAISCEKQDLNKLTEFMKEKLEYICGNPNRENPTVSQARHRQHLEHCLQNLDEYFDICSSEFYDMAIANQKIRDAMYELNKITGHVSTEDVLDVIFKQFCIGK